MLLLEGYLSYLSALGPWQLILVLALVLLIITNAKVLPFAWHVRIFNGYFKHYYFNTKPLPVPSPGSPIIFQPTIYTARTALFELDFNLHKSNSTYLTDLDVARGYHVYALFRTGINKYLSKNPPIIAIPSTFTNSGATKPKSGMQAKAKPGPFFPALGGLTANFKREIGPYQTYEIWTRVLSWDSKWVYLISHFVKPGSRKSVTYSDQPWKDARNSSSSKLSTGSKHKGEDANLSTNVINQSNKVFAFFVSKYAFKQGRVTIPPSTFLEHCELLPTQAQAESEKGRELWDDIEEIRQLGQKMSQNVAGLDAGMEFYGEGEDVVFAEY